MFLSLISQQKTTSETASITTSLARFRPLARERKWMESENTGTQTHTQRERGTVGTEALEAAEVDRIRTRRFESSTHTHKQINTLLLRRNEFRGDLVNKKPVAIW